MRAARRKKFFGTGRKKRQIPDEYFEEIYSIEPEEEEEERKDQETQIIDSSFHAFHLCEYCLEKFASLDLLKNSAYLNLHNWTNTAHHPISKSKYSSRLTFAQFTTAPICQWKTHWCAERKLFGVFWCCANNLG